VYDLGFHCTTYKEEKKAERRKKRMKALSKKKVTFAEMFCGVGGFRLGLEKANSQMVEKGIGEERNIPNIKKSESWEQPYRCVWANDNDKYACKIYRKNFGNKELVEKDIREVRTKDIPDHTLLTAGFPCQAFSVAGKRKATKEARGTLFTHIVRIASHKRPELLLLENVKGLLSSESGRTFATILRSLANLGYLLEWQVLNSKHFGVPQNRERVFIVGHLRGKGSRQIFPIGQGDGELGEMEERQETSATIDRSYYKGYDHKRQLISHAVRSGGSLDRHRWDTVVLNIGDGRPNRGTLRKGRTPELNYGNFRIRRLTPTECERLQGFPDGWTEGVSDTQRYKCLGNAVTVNVIEFLGKKLLEK
jgi:DNA-methyltransferase (dcm)